MRLFLFIFSFLPSLLTSLLTCLSRIAIEAKDNQERTPLYYACIESHSEIAQLLLEFGALDSYIDSHG